MLKPLALALLSWSILHSATLTFEGIPDQALVGDYYSDLGYTFTGATSLRSLKAGGTGDFRGEPSPFTVAFSIEGMIVNLEGGEEGTLEFYFSNPYGSTAVRLYSAEDLSGELIGQALFDPTPKSPSKSNSSYGPFVLARVEFVGEASSVAIFSRGPRGLMIDDFKLQPVPEPALSWSVLLVGIACKVASRRLRSGNSLKTRL
jgi:hypothetical protein